MDDENKQTTLEKIQNVDISKKAFSKRVKRAEGVTLRHARKFIFKRIDNAREVRRHIILWTLVIAMIILASGLQLVWYRESYRAMAVSNGGTYAEGVIGKLSTLNPFYASSLPEESLSQLVFSRLLNYDAKGSISYDLADSITVSTDGKTYSLKIRSNALWQDGQPVSVDDALFTFELLKNPATRSTIQGWSQIQVKKVDDKTIQFTLPSVIAAFPHAIAAVPILPKHLLKDVKPTEFRENSFSSKPVGSGPFAVSLVQDIDVKNSKRSVLLEKNSDYYRGEPKLDRFQLSTYADSDSLLKAFKSGEVTAAAGLGSSQIASLDPKQYDLLAQPVNAGVYAMFNTRKLTDRNVRKALQLAIDTSKIRQDMALTVPTMDTPLTSKLLGTNAIKADAPDQKKAGDLLTQAGWILKDGKRYKNGNELVINVSTTKGENEIALKSIVDQWTAIGVTVNATIYDPNDTTQRFVQDTIQPRNYDVLIYELSIGGDPDVYAYWDSTQATSVGYNFSNYSSANADAALASARTRLEPALRQAKYQSFSRQWLYDVPAIGLYQSVLYYAHAKSVNAFDPRDTLVSVENRFVDILYWTASNKTVYKTP